MLRMAQALAVVFAFSALIMADQVTLKNGDHLTGTVVKSDGKTLSFKTDALGSVDIDWSAIEKLSSDSPVFVDQASTKKTYNGKLSSVDGTLEVQPATGATVSISQSDVAALRSADEQKAFELSQHPGLWQGWTAAANVGFALTGGNSQTENLAISFNALRVGLHDKLKLYANTVYATDNNPGVTQSVTANSDQGGARYDHDVSPSIFGFAAADFQADALQDLNLRSILGGGLGWHAIKNSNTTLDLLAGVNYTHESYSASTEAGPPIVAVPAQSNNLIGLTFGDDFSHKLGKSTVLTQNFYFYPDLTNTGEYRGTFNAGTVTKISKRFGWQNSFGDIYVSDPPAGTKKNDVVFTTGLNIALTAPPK